ncbi:MAG: hypothetical protein WBA59_04015 [Moheibacter sp.]
MSEFKYTHDKENFKIRVKTPYDKAFVERARNLRGTWSKSTSEWVFDDSIEEYLKEALIEVYGTTGEGRVEMVNLLIKDFSDYSKHQPVILFGRTIARAFGRDSGAKLGDGIVWIDGNYKSGGSVKNWATEIQNATFEIQNFPAPRLEKKDVQKAIAEGWCIVKENQTQEQRLYADLIEKIKSETDIQKLKDMLIEQIDNGDYADLYNNYYK